MNKKIIYALVLIFAVVLLIPLATTSLSRSNNILGGANYMSMINSGIPDKVIELFRQNHYRDQFVPTGQGVVREILLSQDQLKSEALSENITGDKFVFGDTFILEEEQALEGNLVVLGGTATLKQGSLVENDIILMGGTVEIEGTVEGDVVALGGLLILGSSAVVEGDVNVVAGHMDRSAGATIYGEENIGLEGPLTITVPGGVRLPIPGGDNIPYIAVQTNPFWQGLSILFISLFGAALAVLVVLFLPNQTQRIGQVSIKQAPISGGLGCLTVFALPFILVITTITIIGIPITILTAILFVFVVIYGIIALGTEAGQRLTRIINKDWSLVVSAGIGTFLLLLVVQGISTLIPCLGGIVWTIVGIVGIGAVLLTRFGTRDYPNYIINLEIDGDSDTGSTATSENEARLINHGGVSDENIENHQTPTEQKSGDVVD